MEGTKTKDAAQGSFSTPAACRSDGYGTSDIVLMIVDNQAERTVEILLARELATSHLM